MARRREDVEDELVDWSAWITIMSPPCQPPPQGWGNRDNGHLGYRIMVLPIEQHLCGIYELAIMKQDRKKVVYIGSTCRPTCQRKRGKMITRIKEYCKNGSHKAVVINRALKNGCTIWARWKESDPNNRLQAEADENKMLKQYNYAWNKRNNGAPRKIIDL